MKKFSILTFSYFALSSSLSFAHEDRVQFTEISFNERSEKLEIMHRLSIHDIEHYFGLQLENNIFVFESEDDQRRTTETLLDHFNLHFLCNDSCNQEIIYVGSEIDRGYFWVYQETALPRSYRGITITNNIFMDLWQDQVNMLNIEILDFFDTYMLTQNRQSVSVLIEN
jgi:hypothetical protein